MDTINPVYILRTAERLGQEAAKIALRLDKGHDPDRRQTRNDFACVRVATQGADEAADVVAELIKASRRAERLLRDMSEAGYGDPAQADDLRAALARIGGAA